MPEMKVTRPVVGDPLPFLNSPSDVETIFADSIGTVQSNTNIVKVSFVETTTAPDGNMAVRYVASVAFNRAELRRLKEVIDSVVDIVEQNPNNA